MHVSNSKLFVNVYYRNKKVLSVGSLSFFHGMQLVLAAYVNCAFVACSCMCEDFWKENTKGIKAAMPKNNIFYHLIFFFQSKGISLYFDWKDKTLCYQIWINQNDSYNQNENTINSISDLKLLTLQLNLNIKWDFVSRLPN